MPWGLALGGGPRALKARERPTRGEAPDGPHVEGWRPQAKAWSPQPSQGAMVLSVHEIKGRVHLPEAKA